MLDKLLKDVAFALSLELVFGGWRVEIHDGLKVKRLMLGPKMELERSFTIGGSIWLVWSAEVPSYGFWLN